MLLDGVCKQRTAVIDLILMLAGFISTVLLFKWTFENFSSYDLFLLLTLRKPWFFFYFRSFLSSPFYICVFMNFIVIFITASSLLHHHKIIDNNPANLLVFGHDASQEDFFFQTSLPPPPNHLASAPALAPAPAPATDLSYENQEISTVSTNSDFIRNSYLEEAQSENHSITFKTESLENPKNNGEEKDDDKIVTMEEAWRVINGGENPQKKQLKKSETWPESPQPEVGVLKSTKKKDSKKSMTFNETVSVRCRGGLMRDPSMSMEEFNGRVEAFINKFNNEMRLQRQESEQRFLEMINPSI